MVRVNGKGNGNGEGEDEKCAPLADAAPRALCG